ncbi:MAG: tyrosine-type recombinase/integrase, partial [Actinobacteria bacterium]|nr:tyrosine-type recombinase/integrase [Actinomycetota bacterium]
MARALRPGAPPGRHDAPLPAAAHDVPGTAQRDVADATLRQFARWLVANTDVRTLAEIQRRHFEDYKVWLASQPSTKAPTLAKNTQRQRLRMIRIFFERLIEWDCPDAPGRNPILHGDIPPRPEPIPKFLTDQQAAAFMAAAKAHPLSRYRLVAQVLARTGLRATELCELAADAVTRIGNNGYWLRVPVGKLRNDRMIPMHPEVVDLFANWTATNHEHIRASGRLLADDHAPIDRRTVHRIVARIGAVAGIDDMHPHRLRHTLATQAINREMRLEAIAALLGHRSLEMTLVYAKITNRVVADEYASVCEQIDALYATAATPGALPEEIETKAMARLRTKAHTRMLGNGMCTRPVELDCRSRPIPSHHRTLSVALRAQGLDARTPHKKRRLGVLWVGSLRVGRT